MWRLFVFIRDEFYGETMNVFRTDHRNIYYVPQSVAYFCVGCGELWVRLVVEDQAKTLWQIKVIPCDKCGIGRVWHDYGMNDSLTNALPQKLLAREFLLAHDNPEYYFSHPHALRRHIAEHDRVSLVSRAAFEKLLEF